MKSFFLFLSGIVFFACSQNTYWFYGPLDREPAQTLELEETDEPLITARIPLKEVKKLLRKNIFDPSPLFSRVDKLEFGVEERTFLFQGAVKLPLSALSQIPNIKEEDVERFQEIDVRMVLKLPSAEKIGKTGYMTFEVLKLELNGEDKTNSVPIFTGFLKTLIANTTLFEYFLKIEPGLPEPKTMTEKILYFLKSTNTMFRDNRLTFKLRPEAFVDLSNYGAYSNIKLWQFSPVLLRGTEQAFFQLDLGIGKPTDGWLKQNAVKYNQIVSRAEELVAESLEKFSRPEPSIMTIKDYYYSLKDQEGLASLPARIRREEESFLREIEFNVKKELSKENPFFVQNPEQEFFQFHEQAKLKVEDFVADLKRKLTIEERILRGGLSSTNLPFFEKYLSQKALQGVVQYYRDFQFQGESLFSHLKVIMAPQVPGLYIRGYLNIDYAYLLKILTAEDVDYGSSPLYLQTDKTGKTTFFEAKVAMNIYDDSWLGLDVQKISLFSGPQKFTLSKQTKNGKFILNLAQVLFVNTMAKVIIGKEQQNSSAQVEKKVQDRKQEILARLRAKKKTFTSRIEKKQSLDRKLLQVMKEDFANNPFRFSGKDYIGRKQQILLENFIKYSQETQEIRIKLDPKIINETLLGVKHDIQVWGLLPVFIPSANQVYMQFHVGDGKRSKKFINQQRNSEEWKQGANFVGTQFAAESPIDVKMKFSLNDLNEFLKWTILTPMIQAIGKDNQKKIAKAEREKKNITVYNLKDLKLSIERDPKRQNREYLKLYLSLSLKKYKKKILHFKGSLWKDIKRDEVNLQAWLDLETSSLDKALPHLKVASNEIFLGDQLLRIRLSKTHIKFLKGNLLTKALSLVTGETIDFEEGRIAGYLQKILYKTIASRLHSLDPKKNGSVEIGGFPLNNYAKIILSKKDIYIQINPRASTPAFDTLLLAEKEANGFIENPMLLNAKDSSLSLNFEIVSGMAALDKSLIYKTLKQAQEFVDKKLAIKDDKEFLAEVSSDQLWEKFFFDSDMSKLSIQKQIDSILNDYGNITDLLPVDKNLLKAINKQFSKELGEETPLRFPRKVSLTGIELMYFASAYQSLFINAQKVLDRIESVHNHNYVHYMAFKRETLALKEKYIQVFLTQYEKYHLELNRKILAKGVRDWNYKFYNDAVFADSVYEMLSAQ